MSEMMHTEGSIQPPSPSVAPPAHPHASLLQKLIDAALQAVHDEAAWDQLEAEADRLEQPELVAQAYRQALYQDLDAYGAARLGRRAVRFFEECYGQGSSELVALLQAALERHPDIDSWAFQRLTVDLAVAERWDTLLALYDEALTKPLGEAQRVRLLEEAAQCAKDFAGEAQRAVVYLRQLSDLRPGDSGLAASLERLLERQRAWLPLIEFLRSRLPYQSPADASATRLRIADLWIDRLQEPSEGLQVLLTLLEDEQVAESAYGMLEGLVDNTEAPTAVRHEAFLQLKRRYESDDRGTDVVRAIDSALTFAAAGESADLHREAAERLAARGQARDAMQHYAALLRLQPDATDAREQLRQLAEHTTDHQAFVDALVTAAAAAPQAATRVQLRAQAGDVALRWCKDASTAIACFADVLAEAEADLPLALPTARRLAALYDADDRFEEQLQCLERVAALEHDPSQADATLQRVVQLANQLQAPERALAATEARLGFEPNRRGALDDKIACLQTLERWPDLAHTLDKRAAVAQTSSLKRDFLARRAQVQAELLADAEGAIQTWLRVHQLCPWDNEALQGLIHLYAQTQQWRELAELLEQGSFRSLEQRTAMLVQLGETYHRELQVPELACKALAQALKNAPAHTAARTAMQALLQEVAVASVAAEALASACRETGDWEELLALLPARLGATHDDGRKVSLLREAAEVAELHLQRPVEAHGLLADAFLLRPRQEVLEHEFARLTEQTSRAGEAGGVYMQTGQQLRQEMPRLAAQHFARAGVLYESIEAYGEALESYSQALACHPDNNEWAESVVRAARRTGTVGQASVPLQHSLDALGEDADRLELLASVQREQPSEALYTTLMSLANLGRRPLPRLREAAQLALEVLADPALGRRALKLLYDAAARALRRGTSSETAPEQRPTAHLLWAIDRLEEMDAQAERHQERYTLLVDAAALPLADEYRDALAQRGAQVAEETLHDRPAALALYQELLARKPGDEALIETIDRLFDAEGLLPQRIHLRRTQLEGVDNPEKKRALRLLISQLVDALAAFAGRDEMLLASLADQPGDRASLDAIERDWRDRHRFAELVDLYAHQAQQVAAAGARERAAELWLQAGIFADENLAAPERATQLIGAAVALVPSEDALDRLAILTRQLGRHKEQARWLEQRLSLAAPSESLDIALQLVDAHLAAGDDTRAIAVLEQARQHHPSTERLWRKLAELYRAHEVWPALATLLSDVVAAGDDAELVLELIHEASAIFRDKLQRPEGAIDCLERGVALHPDSSALKLSLADCLSAAGRLEEAEQLLRVVVDSFGRRWSAGRADVHRRLAQVLGARGQSQAAIEELELATNMNRADAASLTLLGSLSLQARDLDRAERAYRALLLVARRSHGSASGAPSVSEVLYELHRIADARGDQAQAEELRESAVDTATQHPEEFDRMQALLLADQQYELFVRMVDTRLDALHDAAERAALLVRLAHLYCDPMERPSLALDRCLAALELDVDNDDIHRFALDIAQSCDGVERYTDALQQWLDKMRRAADSRLAGALSLRLGAVEEHVRGNLDAAIEIYRRVEATSDVQVPAWLALGRALVKKDDGQQAVMLFERVLASERSDVAARVEALQHLAELRLQVGAGADSVVQLLQSTDVQLEPLSLTKILRRVLQVEPTHREALALFAERARHFDDPHMLLEYFEFRAADANVSLEDLREGAERAHAIGDRQRAEALLRRAVEVVQARSPESGEAAWAMLRLADLSEEGGDVSAALGWLCQAADALPDAQRRLVQGRIAELASREPGGDLELAVRTYDALHAAEPDNPKFIDALLIVYRRLQDVDSFEALARTAIDDCHSVERRNALRMQWVEFISADSERSADAVELLKQVLQESPEHSDATERLTRLYEQSGYDEELVRLLSGQLDAAELAGDGETMAPLALRLGALLAKVDRDDAITTYRRALDLSPHHRALVEQLLDLWRADDGVAERAELLERLLQTESGAAAARLTEEIAQLWRQVDDVAGVQRVLELGLARCPEHRALRDQLEAWYREGEVWDALADFLVQSAAHDSDPERAVARLEEAATLHDTHLGDPVRAAEVLEQALNLMPNNVALLQHLVTTLRAGDALDAAAAHVEAVLARQPDMPATEQVSLRTLLAELHSEQGQEAAGVRELELAYALDAQVAPALLAMLETWRQSNHIAGNEAEERQALMRSCEILQAMGETARAEEALGQWLQEHPDDVQGWSWLAAAAEAEENWEELIACSERLLELEQDEALVTTVLKLAAAAEALGEPARALAPLRQVYERMPAHAELFQRLQDLYAASDAFAELADLLLLAAAHVPDEQERFTLLLRAGELLVQQVYDPERAVEALQQALTLQPEHHQALLALTDALTALDRLEEAGQVLADAITNHRKKRSPELAELQHKMAVVARMSGDQELESQWLQAALASDKNNAQVAADLAWLSLDLQQYDTALQALRAITLMRTEGPMSRAMAFLLQAKVWHERGEVRRAELWAKKARSEDPSLQEAEEFLQQLGAGA